MELDNTCVLYIDGGTTRTRAWAAVRDDILATESVTIGARDAARESTSEHLAEALRQMVARVTRTCRDRGASGPAVGVAAGMITSGQGLVEVPHVEAPAGAEELARGAVEQGAGDFGLPLVLVPGIRSGPPTTDRDDVGDTDIMRGEEVLALGLVSLGLLAGGGLLLSLGSHWKALRVDGHGRVAASVSTLGGELVSASGTHTILASSLSPEWPTVLSPEWVEAGASRARRDGLPRALYCVRLLDQRAPSTPDERRSFLVGAVMAACEDVLLPGDDPAGRPVVLAGPVAVATAWAQLARERQMAPVILQDGEREAAFRAGCRAVLAARAPGKPS